MKMRCPKFFICSLAIVANFTNISISDEIIDFEFTDFLELAISGSSNDVLALSSELEKISKKTQKEGGTKVGSLMSLLSLTAVKDQDLAKYSIYQKLLFDDSFDTDAELAFKYLNDLANSEDISVHLKPQESLALLFPKVLSASEEKFARLLATQGVYYDIRRHAENYRLGLSYEKDYLKSLDLYLYAYLHGDTQAFHKLQKLILSTDIDGLNISEVAATFDQVQKIPKNK